jgi:hypothetical protein
MTGGFRFLEQALYRAIHPSIFLQRFPHHLWGGFWLTRTHSGVICHVKIWQLTYLGIPKPCNLAEHGYERIVSYLDSWASRVTALINRLSN